MSNTAVYAGPSTAEVARALPVTVLFSDKSAAHLIEASCMTMGDAIRFASNFFVQG